jgi:hypothetical protein
MGNKLMRTISARAKAVSRCACHRSPRPDGRGTARQGVQTGTEFRGRLSPESRYAETDGARSPQFEIRNCQGFFSGVHFGMDDWGNSRLNFCRVKGAKAAKSVGLASL